MPKWRPLDLNPHDPNLGFYAPYTFDGENAVYGYQPTRGESESYIKTKLALFDTFTAWESVYLIWKQAAFDWLKIIFNVNRD